MLIDAEHYVVRTQGCLLTKQLICTIPFNNSINVFINWRLHHVELEIVPGVDQEQRTISSVEAGQFARGCHDSCTSFRAPPPLRTPRADWSVGRVTLPHSIPRTVKMKTTRNEQRSLVQRHDPIVQRILIGICARILRIGNSTKPGKKSLQLDSAAS